MADIRAQAAREHHLASLKITSEAARHRQMRNMLVCQLRREDPVRWTYRRLALLLSVSQEMIAKILREGQNARAEQEGQPGSSPDE